jgi:hypothetical protein
MENRASVFTFDLSNSRFHPVAAVRLGKGRGSKSCGYLDVAFLVLNYLIVH